MIAETIFHPTRAFEKSFFESNKRKSIFVVALASLFLSLTIFLLTSSLVYSVFAFMINIVNWFVLSGVLFFFEFVHTKKKGRKGENNFWKCACVIGNLWELNLFAYFVLFLSVWLIPFFSGLLADVLVGVLFLFLILIAIAWLIASFRMLRVVFGVQKGKLLLNWIILMVLNSLVVSFITNLLASLILL
jgi:hypothetical protein